MFLIDFIMSLFKTKNTQSGHVCRRVSLKGAEKFLARIGTIGVWSEDDKRIYDKYEINQQVAEQMINEILNGKWNKLVMELDFIDEGTMVKRLNKIVNKEWTDCMVIHNMNNKGMALIYVSTSKQRCYELIANQGIYMSEDTSKIRQIPFENARLPEYIVHKDRKEIDKAIRVIADNIECLDEILDNSTQWATERTSGPNGFMKTCVKLGAVKA